MYIVILFDLRLLNYNKLRICTNSRHSVRQKKSSISKCDFSLFQQNFQIETISSISLCGFTSISSFDCNSIICFSRFVNFSWRSCEISNERPILSKNAPKMDYFCCVCVKSYSFKMKNSVYYCIFKCKKLDTKHVTYPVTVSEKILVVVICAIQLHSNAYRVVVGINLMKNKWVVFNKNLEHVKQFWITHFLTKPWSRRCHPCLRYDALENVLNSNTSFEFTAWTITCFTYKTINSVAMLMYIAIDIFNDVD